MIKKTRAKKKQTAAKKNRGSAASRKTVVKKQKSPVPKKTVTAEKFLKNDKSAEETTEAVSPIAEEMAADTDEETEAGVPETAAKTGEDTEKPARGYTSKDSLMLYFDEIRAVKILTEKEEKEYIRKAQKGSIVDRERIIKANLKLVVKIAKRYEYFGVPLIDLIEEGNIGLMKAVEKFKPQLGFRFSTYATWWIKQSINRAIANQKNTIRIPVHILDIYHKYLKLMEKTVKDTGKFPDKETAARKLGIDPIKLDEILNIIKTPRSLDLEYENEDSDSSRTLKDTIKDDSAIKPDDDFFERDKNEKLLELVQKLKPNEQEVILSRFGLANRNILTLEDIGTKLKLTRERIRQIEAIAIKKLHNLMKSKENT
ncbi:MAG: sigma-70 family RNA polymerase sigma factor [Spirochaetia bacterium]|nr:sigma-70 family RNA polymerase sigma factor [Spirochaetia bacterium]